MIRLLVIDPGTTESGVVSYIDGKWTPVGKLSNLDTLRECQTGAYDELAIEGFMSYGRPVGRETFEACYWLGRFVQAHVDTVGPGALYRILYRRDVKVHVCPGVGMRANDGQIRQALIDMLGAPGTKKTRGPTYGFKRDMWQALALGVTYVDQRMGEPGRLDLPETLEESQPSQ